jgi:hypothetical protein
MTVLSQVLRKASLARAALFSADALLFIAVWYLVVDVTLLACVDVLTPTMAGLRAVPLIGAWVAIAFVIRRGSPGAVPPVIQALLDVTVALLCFVVFPALFIRGGLVAEFSTENRWIATEWDRIPKTLFAIAQSSWYQFPFTVALFALLATLRSIRGLRWVVRGALLGLFSLVLVLDYRAGGYSQDLLMPHFALPILLMLAASFVRFGPWFVRIAAANVVVLTLVLFYFGASPLPFLQREPDPKLFTLLFPRETLHHEALFYGRDGWVDREGRVLFQTYGPASGMARIDLVAGQFGADPISYHGTIRYFWTDDRQPWLFGGNNQTGELLVFAKDPFALIRKVPLGPPDSPRIAYSLVADPALNRLYVAFENPIGVGVYDLTTLERIGGIGFRESGLTDLATGTIRIALDPASQKLFVSFGAVDLANHYRIVRIDPKTLEVEDQLVFEYTGDNFILAPSINRAFDAVFDHGRIREIELFPKLRFVRNIDGPLCSRSMAFDARRGYLYATSFVTGEFLVIDAVRGSTLFRTFVGNKAWNVFFHAALDRVYVSGARGVYLFDPASFERSLSGAADTGDGPGADVPR